MRKPINQRSMKRRYAMLAAGCYILIVLYFCHWGYLKREETVSAALLLEAVNHLLSHPFQIFPIDLNSLACGLMVGLFAPLIAHTEYLRRRDLRPNVENGSAKWNEDIKTYSKKYVDSPLQGTGSPNIILTRDIFLSMDTYKTQRNCNVMCIGGSGTGKSRGLIKPNILQANCSYVITDPSGELLEATGGFLREQGYEIRVFNLVDMEHSDTYNPFRYVRNQEGVLIMLNALIQNTTPKGSKSNDPFWEKAETALLEALCFYALAVLPEEEQNFSTVMKLLRLAAAPEGQDSVLDGLFAALAKTDPEHIAVTSYAVYKSAGGGKTAQSILISCQTRLHTFNLDAIKALTDTDTLDLGSVGDRKVALFCITPTADTTFNYLVALMYTQLFETLYHHAETECERKRLPYHVRFLLDEFANIGTIPEFPQKLSTMRKYEISSTIILQALSQIKALYKDNWEDLISNCDSLLFLGGSDKTTLEYISQTLDKETIRTVNTSRSKGKQGSFSTSYNKSGRELMTPSELRVMDNKNCVYLLRGLDPFFSVKYDLKKHPNHSLCGDSDKKNRYDVKKEKITANM